jgi:hypothetical protein
MQLSFLLGEKASIHRKGHAGDESRGVGAKINDRGGDFRRSARSPDRVKRFQMLAHFSDDSGSFPFPSSRKDDLGAGAGEGMGGRFANTGGPSSHEGNFVFE